MVQTKKHNKILIGLVAIALAVVCVLLPFISVKRDNVYADSGTFAPTVNADSFICDHWQNQTTVTTNMYYLSILPYVLQNSIGTIGITATMTRTVSGTPTSATLNMYSGSTLIDYIDYSTDFTWTPITGSTAQECTVSGNYRFNNEVGGNNYVGFNFTVLFIREPVDSNGGSYVYYDSFSPSEVYRVKHFWLNTSSSKYYQIEYIDRNNVALVIRFKEKSTSVNTTSGTPIDYYLTPNAVYTSAQEKQESYNQGYAYGYTMGENAGLNTSSSASYNAGYNAGYYVGYDDGVADDNDYTFLGVIGAVIDAPIQAITGLLNFELFGVNLSALFFGLITVAIIIAIIRYIKGGK